MVKFVKSRSSQLQQHHLALDRLNKAAIPEALPGQTHCQHHYNTRSKTSKSTNLDYSICNERFFSFSFYAIASNLCVLLSNEQILF